MKLKIMPPIALLTEAIRGVDITERKRLEQEILAVSEREPRRIGQDVETLCQRLGGSN